MNKIIIMGRMTKNPEVRQANGGLSVCNFSVAVDRPYSKDAEKKVDFIDCVAFRKTAEFVGKWFNKGKPIAIEGRLQSRDWTDKNGTNRRSWEIIVENVEFCGGDKVQKAGVEVPADIKPGEFAPLPDDGELPFDVNDDLDGLPL